MGRSRVTHARPLAGTVFATVLLAWTRVALACGACRGAGGAGGALTASDERFTVSLGTLARDEIGSWDARGRVHGEPHGVSANDVITELAAGVRVVRAVELAAFFGAGDAWFRAPGYASTTGVRATDLFARVRVDLLAEDPAHPARLSSATWFTLRAPTSSLFGDTVGSTAGLVGAFGLGTWEFALGADLRRTFAGAWQPFAAVEGALRLPDDALGFSRALGPRVTARTGVTYFANDVWAVSALAEWGWEGDVSVRGQMVPDSWQQRTSVALAASGHFASGLRAAFTVATDVPIDGIGRNADATVRVGLTVGYSSVVPAWRACPMDPAGASPTVARASAIAPAF